jgi:hypothetical protein
MAITLAYKRFTVRPFFVLKTGTYMHVLLLHIRVVMWADWLINLSQISIGME